MSRYLTDMLAVLENKCPLAPETQKKIDDLKASFPSIRVKSVKTVYSGRHRNKMTSDMDHRLLRCVIRAQGVYSGATIPRDPYLLGFCMQLFLSLPWKEYSLYFPDFPLRHPKTYSMILERVESPDFLAGRNVAADLFIDSLSDRASHLTDLRNLPEFQSKDAD